MELETTRLANAPEMLSFKLFDRVTVIQQQPNTNTNTQHYCDTTECLVVEPSGGSFRDCGFHFPPQSGVEKGTVSLKCTNMHARKKRELDSLREVTTVKGYLSAIAAGAKFIVTRRRCSHPS